jgi:hypothetical protein
VQVAKFPNGAMTENARQVLWFWDKVRGVSKPGQIPAAPEAAAVVGGDLA